jgi:hypothetical protein
MVVLIGSGSSQLAASWHEVAVRHVRCADHGELTHVTIAEPSAVGRAAPSSLLISSARAEETGAADTHEHCALAFVVRAGTEAPRAPVATRFSPPETVTHRAPTVAPRPGRTVVLASAPKTSPPSA